MRTPIGPPGVESTTRRQMLETFLKKNAKRLNLPKAPPVKTKV